jgi:hypothetical protein
MENKETLEEFIIREGYPIGSQQEIFEDGVRSGVRFQQERSYSEEEVLDLLQDFANEDDSNVIIIKEWFEQFKKK